MTRPTHILPDGSVVFPAGHDDATPLPAGYWEANDAQAAWRAVRAQRNALLASCDWTQSLDSPLSSAAQAEWAEYRQALRDVTAQSLPVEWPAAPAP